MSVSSRIAIVRGLSLSRFRPADDERALRPRWRSCPKAMLLSRSEYRFAWEKQPTPESVAFLLALGASQAVVGYGTATSIIACEKPDARFPRPARATATPSATIVASHMRFSVTPARSLKGSIRLPGDKSISHRYGMLAAVAEGVSRIENYSTGADCASTLGCMASLGASSNVTAVWSRFTAWVQAACGNRQGCWTRATPARPFAC